MAEVRDFVDNMLNDRPPRVTGEDGLRALEIAVAAENSYLEGKPLQREPSGTLTATGSWRNFMTQTIAPATYKSPLHEMTQTTPTCLWNDSASIQELTYSIEHGAVGATCNPVIVLGVLKKEMSLWKDRIRSLIEERPTATEDQIGWQLVREISVKAAGLLKPVFDAHRGKNGRLSIQTDPRLFRDSKAIVEQAEEFNRLAPNMIVKIPVTRAGIPAIEEATYRGISINATVCFTLPQCIAVAEAVERGLKRREREGKDITDDGTGVHDHGGPAG